MKASDEHHNELLTAYFDGELSHAEQVQVEQTLFGKPEFRQLLQQWAVLRVELQSLGEKLGSSPQAPYDCSNGDLLDGAASDQDHFGDKVRERPNSSALAQAIMERIAGANREGRAKWQVNAAAVSGSKPDGIDGDLSELSKNPEVAELKSSAEDHWLSDYRKVTPKQRMRRWAWQMSAIITVASGLFLTVYFNGPPSDVPPLASHLAERGDGRTDFVLRQPPALRDQGATSELLAGLENTHEATIDGDESAADTLEIRMEMSGMAAATMGDSEEDSDFSLGGVGISAGYSGFVVFAVGDHERGLEQMQSVLAKNEIEPVEILEVDGIQAVILSGELKTISDLLGDFQAAGDNSVAFMSKVGMPQAFDAISGQMAGAGHQVRPNNEAAEVADTSDSVTAADVVAADIVAADVVAAETDKAIALEYRVPSEAFSAEGMAPPATQVLSEIELRNQVVVLGNSFSTAAPGVTLEQFFNRHVPRPRIRIPYEDIVGRSPSEAIDLPDTEQNPPAFAKQDVRAIPPAELNAEQGPGQVEPRTTRAIKAVPLQQEPVTKHLSRGAAESPMDRRARIDEQTSDESNIVRVVVVLRPKNFDVPGSD